MKLNRVVKYSLSACPECRVGKPVHPSCFVLDQTLSLSEQFLISRPSTSSISFNSLLSFLDTSARALNNSTMPRPEAVRRVKSYSAATGYVYQYYFYAVEKARRGNSPGTEYVYMVSVDRQHVFPLKIFVVKESLDKWSARTGQQLTGTEEYAVAKMRLFQAFDEIEGLAAKSPDLLVDDSNLEGLLSQLDL